MIATPTVTRSTDTNALPRRANGWVLMVGVLTIACNESVDLRDKLARREMWVACFEHTYKGIEVASECLGLADGEFTNVGWDRLVFFKFLYHC